MNVMLVDDYPLLLRGIAKSYPWEENGFPIVAQAENGRRALEILESQPVDILITDIRMPVMDGLELIREVRALYPAILIVVLSAYDDFAQVRAAFQLGACDYLLKQELNAEAIQAVLERLETAAHIERDRQELPPLCKSQNQYIRLFGAYIERHFAESGLRVEDAAAALGISVGHMGKLLYRETGCHFAEYLNRFRVERAKALLAGSTLRVYEVADRTGYNNVEHFTRVFKKLVGLSPTVYANRGRL